MKVLVTGAAGFIGSHLCDYLLLKGHEVVGTDNLITGSDNNLKHALKDKKFKFLKQDLVKEVPDEKFDWIFNAASLASPIHYSKHPIETLLVGSQGLYNCLELARKSDSRLVQLSTSEIYGDPKVHPQVESYWGNVNPIGPRSCYDESKRYGEALCKAYEKIYGLDIRIARIFNTYGTRMAIDDGRLIPELTLQALKEEPLVVFGDGNQSRSFCYISDMVEGLYLLMEKKGLNGQVVNLGNSNEFTVLEFAKVLLELTNSSSKIEFKPALQDDPRKRCPNILKAKKLLNWKPKVELKAGMVKTIEYFKNFV